LGSGCHSVESCSGVRFPVHKIRQGVVIMLRCRLEFATLVESRYYRECKFKSGRLPGQNSNKINIYHKLYKNIVTKEPACDAGALPKAAVPVILICRKHESMPCF